MNRFSPTSLLSVAAFALIASSAQAALIVSYAETPGEMTSKVTGVSVYNFDSLSTGYNNNAVWSGVGTFDQLYIVNQNNYGGAGNVGKYSAQRGNGSTTNTVGITTLTLDTTNGNHAYFGFWWSAGDPYNQIKFYDGDTLVASFTTSTLLTALATQTDYYGKPGTTGTGSNPRVNMSEAYAFINFFGMDGTSWNKIEFINNSSSSAFESDNYTDRVIAWNPETEGPLPGIVIASVDGETTTVIPEPSVALLGALGALGLLRRRRVG